MSIARYMDEEDVIRKGMEVLLKELGPIETFRFINMPKKKRIESVKRHREWQKKLDKEEFFNEVFSTKSENR
jgi:predicted ATP-dependent Lon-type protease